MYKIVHLCTGVGWNLAALGLLSLQRYLVYPTMVENVRMAMLSIIGHRKKTSG
jgi:hypothetical protein